MKEQNQKPCRNSTRKGVSIRKYDILFKRQVATEILIHGLSIQLAAVKYGIAATTIRDWVKLFSYELTANVSEKPMNPDKEKKVQKEDQEKEELTQSLEAARLKIASLEIMIELAEREFNIDIRKKPGTKQSM